MLLRQRRDYITPQNHKERRYGVLASDYITQERMKADRIKGIDGFKGMFSIIILLYHYYGGGNWFVHGYLGVDFFFIVSGFFWMMSMKCDRYTSGKQYLQYNFCKYWPITTCIYISLVFFRFVIYGWGIAKLREMGLHILYEIFYIHLVGIDSNSYVLSLIWYIAVMIFVLTVFTSLYIWKKDFFLTIFLPIAIIGCCTYLFAIWGSLADFRGINKGDFFIKGVYRGVMDMGVGIVVYHFMPMVNTLLDHIRIIWIVVLELLTLVICFCSILTTGGNSTDLLIIPCSCIFIFLCYAEKGILYRIMECKLFKCIGILSLYIYLTQAFSMTIAMRLCGSDKTFSLMTSAILIILTIGTSALFQYIIVPGEIWIAKKIFFSKYPEVENRGEISREME